MQSHYFFIKKYKLLIKLMSQIKLIKNFNSCEVIKERSSTFRTIKY